MLDSKAPFPSVRDPLALKAHLEDLFQRYHRKDFMASDPVVFLQRYPRAADREVVGLIAALLAYGRVAQIMKSVDKILTRLGPAPCAFLKAASADETHFLCDGFVHRFTRSAHLFSLLIGIGRVLRHHGSLEACFMDGFNPGDATVLPALGAWVGRLRGAMPENPGHLLPDPGKGSAMKRVNLFLRWMVRRDEVDPGGWSRVSPAKLIVPLDVHLHRAALALGLTRRHSADMRTALEVTGAFRVLCSEDPVRYDFCLTRIGMQGADALS